VPSNCSGFVGCRPGFVAACMLTAWTTFAGHEILGWTTEESRVLEREIRGDKVLLLACQSSSQRSCNSKRSIRPQVFSSKTFCLVTGFSPGFGHSPENGSTIVCCFQFTLR
jgi:hypothetical protein